ncbi:hypothetical protein [Salinispira pacifica]|uniref:Neutral metalloprotease n=1 Tax=Salinispira pacifica TaxID=1307761 RepID=V5WGC5_9SPIO|nr:hypothetical protein [Salinispira pacifica]AHC14216.1 hypothetical protein L21SP2_0794 [Salinispira pacifica]
MKKKVNISRFGLPPRTGFMLLALLTVFMFSSCGNLFLPDERVREFNVRNIDNSFYTIKARLKAHSESAIIYVEKGEDVDKSLIQTMLEEFDSEILPLVTEHYGPPADLDENGRVILLLLDIKDGYKFEGDPFIAGYFDGTDLIMNPNSNGGEILYIDTDPGLENLGGILSTVAHEYQHLVNFSRWNVFNDSGGYTQVETWVNEGLSLSAEELYTDGLLENRVGYYYFDPGRRYVKGNNFVTWDRDLAEDYSSVYLFFHWLRAHGGGRDVYSDIFSSPYSDYRAITKLIADRDGTDLGGLDVSNNDAATWENALGTWLAATVLLQPSGLYGFRDFDSVNHNESNGVIVSSQGGILLAPEYLIGYSDEMNTEDQLRLQDLYVFNSSYALSGGDRLIYAHPDFVSEVDQSDIENEAGLSYLGFNVGNPVVATAIDSDGKQLKIYQGFSNFTKVDLESSEGKAYIIVAFNPMHSGAAIQTGPFTATSTSQTFERNMLYVEDSPGSRSGSPGFGSMPIGRVYGP